MVPGAPPAAGVPGIADDAGFADDLAADTFATAYRRRGTYRPDRASLRSWLYGIAVNLLRNHWRTEQRLLERDAQLAATAATATAATATAATAAAAPDAARGDLEPRLAAAAFARLSREQREVLLLHAWAGLDHHEIAAVLRIPRGTVSSRLSRARASVRAELGYPAHAGDHAERNGHA